MPTHSFRSLFLFSLCTLTVSLALPAQASTTVSASELTELLGADWNNSAGRTVTSAGDVNNDGFDDFLVGAKGSDAVGSAAGAVYLVYGSSDVLAGGSLSVYAKFTGEVAGDAAGGAVSGAGDVNNDGFDDFLIGANANDDADTSAGAVYLIYGQSTAYTGTISLSTMAEFTGEVANDNAGYSVSSAGDVNNDTYADFLVGAYANDDAATSAGAAYLVYGQSTAYTGTISLSTMAEFTGEVTSDFAGYSVSSAGDVNNDTYADFVIGAYGNDDGGSRAGAAYLIYGQSAAYTGTTSLSTVAEFSGEAAADRSGTTVSSAGDVNNDTYADFLVGAYANDDAGSSAGAAYLIYGQSAAYTGTTSLSTVAEFTGEAASDNAGYSLSSAGDVNNDGFDDVLLSAYQNDDAATSAGAAYLVYGQSAAYTGTTSLSTMAEFTGEAESDGAATSLSSAGDVNGDGFYDLIVGAYGNDDADVSAGAAYLIYGQSTAYTGTSSLSAAVEFLGESTNTRYIPHTFESAGDVNGDGFDDVLVGSYLNDDAASNAGAVFLMYGSLDGLDSASFDEAAEFTGEVENDYSGYSVSSAGDVNNDGFDDILVSAYRSDVAAADAGAAYLIYGQSAAYTGTISLSTMAEFTGEAESDFAGVSVSSAGDVNGDGFDDMMVGAYGNSDGAGDAGAVYIIYGQSTAYTGTTSLSTFAEFTGEDVDNSAGFSVSSAGDVNGDGFDDMMVGAFGNSDGAPSAGAVYLIYGQSTAYTGTTSLSTVAEFTGEFEGASVGEVFSSAGDVNGDGFDDMMIGYLANDDVAANAGAVYLIYGQSDAYTGTASLSTLVELTGEAEGDYFGYSVSSAGDVNNDGFGDILVSSYLADSAQADSGNVYLVFGSAEQLTSQSITTVADVVFQGIYTSDILGYLVAEARDTNNDGYDEVVMKSQVDSGGPFYIGYLYIDHDADGLFAAESVLGGTDANDNDFDNDSVETESDCDDADADISTEVEYYADIDSDGLGDASNTTLVCSLSAPEGYVSDATDANDNDFDNDSVETESDCDDADATLTVEITYYLDSDGDSLGEEGTGTLFCALSAPEGYSVNALDTNDTISNAGVEIPDDGVDNDGDAEVDEVNTVDDNGVHPTFGTGDVTSTEDYSTFVADIEGAKKGKIKVTYADNSTYSFVVFSSFTKSTKTKIKSFDDTGLALVLHPKGKKLALVNVYTGEVYDRVTLSKKKKYKKNSFKILDVRGDGSLEVVITSKRDSDKIRLSLVKVKKSTLSLKKKDSETLTFAKVVTSKTKKHKKDLVLRNKKGKTIATYDVGKKYKLTFSE